MSQSPAVGKAHIGLIGLAVMGQNLALNVASKGFDISVWNRSHDKTVATEARAREEVKNAGTLTGYEKIEDFVQSIAKPRAIILLVQAGKPVDAVIAQLAGLLEPNDIICDGGNEWYANSERRAAELKPKGILYMAMGVSGQRTKREQRRQQQDSSVRCCCVLFRHRSRLLTGLVFVLPCFVSLCVRLCL